VPPRISAGRRGRRKTSVARVYLTPGTGKWDVNGRTLGDYFPRPSLVQHIQQSFTATDTLGAFDVQALVERRRQSGQAGALRWRIARALVEADSQHRTKLRAAGLLTRDPRRRRAQEAGPRGRPEAVPVQQAVDDPGGVMAATAGMVRASPHAELARVSCLGWVP
jgi:small subunit ribosomal protein S9